MKHGQQQQGKRIIFVFLVFTLVLSSLSAVAFVTGGNLAFASSKKKDDSNGDGGGGDGSGSDKGGNSGGSGDNGGGGSTDNSGTETTGGSDNNNGDDTSNTSPSTMTEQTTPSAPSASNRQTTCPDGSAPDNSGNCPTPADNGVGAAPPQSNQQTNACPDGSTPDSTSGTCPTSSSPTVAPNQPPAAQDGGHILVMPNGDGTCPPGSHKFGAVCEKDTVTPSTTGTTPASNAPPLTPQQQYEACLKGIGGGIPGNCRLPAPSSTNTPASNAPPLTPQQQYENCLKGIGGGIPGNCKPPTTTEQNVAPQQTLTQNTCPPLPIDANGRCPGIDARGGGLGLPPRPPPPPPYQPPPRVIPEGNGVFRLPTAQPIFNDPLGHPLGTCPSGNPGTHDVLGKCVYNDVSCPSGTHLSGFGLTCVPTPPVEKPFEPDGSCNGEYDPISDKCYQDSHHAPPCPDGSDRGAFGWPGCSSSRNTPLPITNAQYDGKCDPGGGVHTVRLKYVCFSETAPPNQDGSCQSGYFSTGGNCKLTIHEPLPDGSCPAGYHNIRAPTAPVPRGTLCKLDELKSTSDDITSTLPGGFCPIGYQKRNVLTHTACLRNS